MPRMLNHAVTIPLVLLLAACGTQVPLTRPVEPARPIVVTPPTESPQLQILRTMVAQQDRLYLIAAPLLVNNAQLCKGNARNLIGFSAKTRYSYSDDYAEAAQKALGLDERLRVMGVLSGSGAARAGVKQGDILIAVEGQPMPQGPNAERSAAGILAPMVKGRSSVALEVLRGNSVQSLKVPLTLACGFGIELGNADHVNAYADGRRVLITRGMLNFVRSDDELAYVLARELAHNTLAHADRQRINATAGGIVDNLIRMAPDTAMLAGSGGLNAFPAPLDSAADRLALYMLARGGYSIDNASRFWQRLAAQQPASVTNGYNALHPLTAARVTAMDSTVAEIKGKQAARKPLMP